jgi:hypothetical protein
MKQKLDVLELVEDVDYLLLDVQQVRKNRGAVIKKVYMITPEAFKKCLMRAQRRPAQKIDTFKSIFDELDIKRDRLKLYQTVVEIGEKIRPDVVVKKK